MQKHNLRYPPANPQARLGLIKTLCYVRLTPPHNVVLAFTPLSGCGPLTCWMGVLELLQANWRLHVSIWNTHLLSLVAIPFGAKVDRRPNSSHPPSPLPPLPPALAMSAAPCRHGCCSPGSPRSDSDLGRVVGSLHVGRELRSYFRRN
jgi:hypothetical protein